MTNSGLPECAFQAQPERSLREASRAQGSRKIMDKKMEIHWGYSGVILYWDSGKENVNYCNGVI